MISSLFKYAPVQVFSALAVFALIAVQTAYLSPALYGLLAVVMVLLELVRTITTVWLNSAMLRLFPTAEKNVKNDIAQTILALLLAGCLIGLLFFAFGLYLYSIFTIDLFLIISVLLFTKAFFQFQLEIARLKDKTNRYRIALLTQSLLSIFAVWLMLVWLPTINAALIGLVISYVLSTLIFGLPCVPKFNKNRAKDIIKYGMPLMFSGGIGLLSSRLDRLLIPTFSGLFAAGIYAAQANLLYGLLSLIFMIVALPLYPDLVKSVDDKEQLQKKHSKYFTLLLTIALPSLAGLIMLNQEIVTVFLGSNYLADSPYLFSLLALAIFINNVKGHFIDHGLQFLMKTKKLATTATIGFLLNIVLTPIMLFFFGLLGAAISLLLLNSVLAVLSAVLAIKNGYTYAFDTEIIKVITATCLMAFLLFYLKEIKFFEYKDLLNLVILVFFTASSYFVLLFLLDFMKSRTVLLGRVNLFTGR